ncbi:hypothetical protein DFQ27_001891, partial [Actinomortierella ambigua]
MTATIPRALTPEATVNMPMRNTGPNASLSVSSPSDEPKVGQPFEEFTTLYHIEELNDIDSQVSLTQMCETSGGGVTKDSKKASTRPHQAAEQGHLDAMCCVGDTYARGHIAEQNDDEAARWYKNTSGQGNFGSQNSFDTATQGGLLAAETDFGAVPLLPETSRYGIAVPKSSLAQAMSISFTDQRNTQAVVTRQAAERGDATAQNALELMYRDGQDVEQSDVEAVKWYNKAASQGNPNGQNNLGNMYKNGQGVEQSDVEAVKWYTKAASQGNPREQFNLGVMYENGRGVEQSDFEAVK